MSLTLTIEMANRISLEESPKALVVDSVLRQHYAALGEQHGYTEVPEKRGGARGGGRPRKPVIFRNPAPTRGDVSDMLRLQQNYEAVHQLAPGEKDAETRRLIKASLTNYGQHITVAVAQNRIVGAVTMYPVTQSVVTAVIAQAEIKQVLNKPHADGDVQYIHGFNILPTHRRSRRVIKGLVTQLKQLIIELAPTTVYTTPVTPTGKALALKMGFMQCPGQEGVEEPLYVLQVTTDNTRS